MTFRNNKRSYSEDEPCHVTCKNPRQLDHFSLDGCFPCNSFPEKPPTSVNEAGGNSNKFIDKGRVANHSFAELSLIAGDKQFGNFHFGSTSGLSWFTSLTREEDAISEQKLPISCSHGFCVNDCSSWIESGMFFSSLIDYPQRKHVAIGPNHQVDVPDWQVYPDSKDSGRLSKLASNSCQSGSEGFPPFRSSSVPSRLVIDDKWDQVVETSVISAPELNAYGCNAEKIGSGRADCSCPDEGSIRCVRQHIKEAREKLYGTLGLKTFAEMGFCEMGEDVAQKWREEEEQLFHQVVFSNPASLGRNFWDHLAVVFPTRTKKDLVSYYFNVFMLRKRAEQNRLDPLNIDSDNDEWQASDDSDEFAMSEEDEDSVVESPINQVAALYNAREDLYHEDEDCDDSDNSGDDVDEGSMNDVSINEYGGPSDQVLQGFGGKSSVNKSFDSALTEHRSDNVQNFSAEQELQDESCTSFECLHNGAASSGPSDVRVAQEERAKSGCKISNGEYGASLGDIMGGHGFEPEACGLVKAWDSGFFSGFKNHIELLPTCSMIEEVFRNENWNDKRG